MLGSKQAMALAVYGYNPQNQPAMCQIGQFIALHQDTWCHSCPSLSQVKYPLLWIHARVKGDYCSARILIQSKESTHALPERPVFCIVQPQMMSQLSLSSPSLVFTFVQSTESTHNVPERSIHCTASTDMMSQLFLPNPSIVYTDLDSCSCQSRLRQLPCMGTIHRINPQCARTVNLLHRIKTHDATAAFP